MGDPEHTIVDALLDALTLEWEDNGNISASAVRDSCITALARALNIGFDAVVALIEKRVASLQ